MHAREASSSDGDAAPSAGPGTAPGKNACVCFTAFSATAFPPGGMRGVREAGACRAGMFFKSVCDRRYASRTRRFPGRSRPRFQSGRYSGRAFSAVRPGRMPCRSLGCHPLARTGSAHFRAQGTELAPLFPEVETSLSQVFRVGISWAGSARPLPWETGVRARRTGILRALFQPSSAASSRSVRTACHRAAPAGGTGATCRWRRPSGHG